MQQIYRGWDRLAYVLALQLIGILLVIWCYRRQPRVLAPALVALAGLVAAQIVFWIWTYPANVATRNWTVSPANWQLLRAQWEYSHLAGAGFQFISLCGLILAALARVRA